MPDNAIITNNQVVDNYGNLSNDYAGHVVGALALNILRELYKDASVRGDRYTITTDLNTYAYLLRGLQLSITSLEYRINLDLVHLFEIDLDKRSISAPPEFQDFIGVVGEHKSETLTFQCDRYYGTVDLAMMTIIVEYINADGEHRVSPILARDYTTFENKILFDWIIDAAMTGTAGIVQFDIRFYMIGTELADGGFPLVYSLRTLPYKTKIVDTLPIDMQKLELEVKDKLADDFEALLGATQQLRTELNAKHVYWNDLI